MQDMIRISFLLLLLLADLIMIVYIIKSYKHRNTIIYRKLNMIYTMICGVISVIIFYLSFGLIEFIIMTIALGNVMLYLIANDKRL